MGDVHALKPLGLALHVDTLDLAVKAVSHLLEHDVGVGALAGMLPHGGYVGKDFIDVGQVEVAAQREVLCPPVVAAQERVNVGKPALARRRVAEVAHVEFAGERQHCLGIGGIGQLVGRQVTEVAVHGVEYLGYRPRAETALAEHKLLAGVGLELDAGEARRLLPTVVLFLHQEVEFVEAVHPRAVLLLVIFERSEQTYHCHAAFMLQRLHCRKSYLVSCYLYIMV